MAVNGIGNNSPYSVRNDYSVDANNCDFSNTTSTSLMFVDGGITEIPTDFMERFPKLTSMTNMFYGCPLGGDLTLTLGSEYTAVGSGRKLGIGGFCNNGVYNNITLNLASNISCYGSGSSNYLRYSGLPTGKVSTKVNLLDGGQIETYSYVSVPCSDSVYYSINSDENFTINLYFKFKTARLGGIFFKP